MATHYQCAVRFRQETENEGFGSLLYQFVAPAPLTGSVVCIMTDVSQQHPSALFDGVIMYGSYET
jgi:hypothetical protein